MVSLEMPCNITSTSATIIKSVVDIHVCNLIGELKYKLQRKSVNPKRFVR
jgi:hypothetical protein